MEEIYVSRSMSRSKSVWRGVEDQIFSKSYTEGNEVDDEEALVWAALEKLPTYDRMRKGVLAMAEGDLKEIDIRSLGLQERRSLLERLVRVAEEDHERFLLKLKNRIDRAANEPSRAVPILCLLKFKLLYHYPAFGMVLKLEFTLKKIYSSSA